MMPPTVPPYGPDSILDLFDGQFVEEDGANRLQRTIDAVKGHEHRSLVIHFHGGLVSKGKALSAAEGLYPSYSDADAVSLFMVWHTSILDVIRQDLKQIGVDDIFRQLLRRVSRFVLAKRPSEDERTRGEGVTFTVSIKDLPRDPERLATVLDELEQQEDSVVGHARSKTMADRSWDLTEAEVRQFEEDLEEDEVLRLAVASVVAGLDGLPEPASRSARRVAPPRDSLLDIAIQEEMRAATLESFEATRGFNPIKALRVIIKHGVRILRRVLARHAADRNHTLYTTVVEEVLAECYIDRIGRHFWKVMKEDPADAFGADPTVYGGTALLQHLKALWEEGAAPKVTLVGHSAGAIYINTLLKQADAVLPAEAKFDVVLLAPAVSFSAWHANQEILNRRIRRLRLFGLNDEVERGYWEVPLIFRGSLLYMVCSLFERASSKPFDPATADVPLLGMERYHTDDSPYGSIIAVKDTLDQLKDYSTPIWTVKRKDGDPPPTGTPGRIAGAQRHGGFTKDPTMRQSLTHMIGTEWRSS